MSEQPPGGPPPPPGKGQLNIPGIGKLPAWFVLGGVAVVIVLIIRNRSSSSSAAAGTATDPAGNTGVIDPATGYVAGSPQDLSALQTSAAIGTPAGTGTVSTSVPDQVTNGPPFTSNAAWTQYAVSVLGQSGYDPGSLTAELGLYVNGQPVTAAQEGDINAAIAVAGYPPVAGANGQPPAINVTGSKAGGGPGSSGGGPGSGSPSGGPITAVPGNFRVLKVAGLQITVAWDPVTVPAGQGPLAGYTIAYGQSPDKTPYELAVGSSARQATITFNSGPGAHGLTHYFEIWARPANPGGPHAGPISAKTQ